MAAGLGNGNLLLASEPMFAARPQNAVSQMAAFEEAKAMMQQNRQLLSQIQQGAPGAGLPGYAPMPKLPNGNGLVPGSMGLQAAAQQLQNLQGAQRLAMGAAQPKPQVLNQAMLNQAAQMMQANNVAASLGYGGTQANANAAAFLQNNQIAAAAAANAQARAAQAQAQAQAQARVAAAMGMLQQQQQQQGALNAAAGRPMAMPNGIASNAQMLALQRAAASGQLVLQNGKPVLLQNGNAVAAQAAANKQTQLLHALQAQQKQLQALNQLKAISSHLQSQGQQGGLQGLPPQAQQQANNINTAALLKQLQLQDAMAKQDALARAAGMQQVNNNALAELLLRQQQQQQQQQMQARANMNAMANGMTAAQVQHLTAQALLQARNQAANSNGQQQHNGMNGGVNGMQLGMNAGAAEALLASLHNKQMAANNLAAMQAQAAAAAAAANGSEAGGAPGSPNGSTSSAGSAHSAASKEQRRLALACVALQLARGGISVEQAINSGIMGGMSVTDVRFIVECYNAERERMRQTGSVAPSVAGSEHEGAAYSPRPPLSSQAVSPAGSVAGSHVDVADHNALHGSGMSHMSRLAAARGEGPTPTASDGGSPRSHTTNGTHPNVAAGEANGSVNGEAPAVGFNAFSYGFFGEPAPGAGGALEGGLLEELEPANGNTEAKSQAGDLTGGMTADEQAWLKAAANANAQMWEGVPDEEGEGNDDLAARLANLDLGSGFF